MTLADAVQNSINSVFCNIGKELGADVVLEYAKRFGFYERPPIDLPSEEVLISGLYRNGRLYDPESPSEVDPGRLAFGQERLVVTPLQMALVAAGVANDGVVMEPKLVERIVAPDGRRDPALRARGMEDGRRAVHGSRPDRDDGASSGVRHRSRRPDPRHLRRRQDGNRRDRGRRAGTTPGSSPSRRPISPEVAVAVALSDQAGTGGATAAPIARAIIEAALGRNA